MAAAKFRSLARCLGRKSVVRFILLLGIGWFAASPAAACSCREQPDVRAALVTADAVFVGEVVALHVLLDPEAIGNPKYVKYGGTTRVTIAVSETLKGTAQPRTLVETGRGPGSCGYDFRIGERYLIYASHYEGAPHRPLTAGICGRTALVGNAESDLTEIRQGLK